MTIAKSKKRNKEVHDPFARLCQHISFPRENFTLPETRCPAEFLDTMLTISPGHPRSQVSLTIQFRCTVDIVQDDIITIHLPKFKGEGRMFSLQQLPHPDGLDIARCFKAVWSGDANIKGRGRGGVPPKQVLLLRCIHPVESKTLVRFGVPAALFLMAPDKLPKNTSKVKIEGKLRCAEGGVVRKQAFLNCTEVKKVPIIDEINAYEGLIKEAVAASGLGDVVKHIAEELSPEDIDQIWEASRDRRNYPVAMPWLLFPMVYREYEGAGRFVKSVMENAIAFTKLHDPLALHREVARNWNVKVGLVVLLEDMLVLLHGAMYPSLTRTALLAAHLATMEPTDVARTFSLSHTPEYSILQEIHSAFHISGLSEGKDDARGVPSRSELLLKKWSAFVSTLLTATMVADSDSLLDPSQNMANIDVLSTGRPVPQPASIESTSGASPSGNRAQLPSRESQLPDTPPLDVVQTMSRSTYSHSETNSHTPSATIRSPPSLYVGVRDVPREELNHLQEMNVGDNYMFPSFMIARQELAWLSGTTSSSSQVVSNAVSSEALELGGGMHSVPDNAIVFEVQHVVEGLELADLSAYPYNREWLLPFSSTYTVVSVTVKEDFNDLTHVVLKMTGSLIGCVCGDFVPVDDRTIASVVMNKIRRETENSEMRVPALAQVAYLNALLHNRRIFFPPTLLRAQYVSYYQEAKRVSESKRDIEDGTVVWQVCTQAAQVLEENVVKPAVWDPLPNKFAVVIEKFFLGRTRTRKTLEDAGLNIDLANYTVDYGGKGPRSIRRVVNNRVTHEATRPVMDELRAQLAALSKQMQAVDHQSAALGITTATGASPSTRTGPTGRSANAGKVRKPAAGQKAAVPA